MVFFREVEGGLEPGQERFEILVVAHRANHGAQKFGYVPAPSKILGLGCPGRTSAGNELRFVLGQVGEFPWIASPHFPVLHIPFNDSTYQTKW